MGKISSYFTLEEFVPKDIYEKFGNNSIWFIDRRIILIADFIRSRFNRPMIINNWHIGQSFQYRGFRPSDCPIGAKYSQHKFGRAIDINIADKEPHEVGKDIIDNFAIYKKTGITTIENPDYTTGWTHLDIRDTGKDELLIVNP